MIDLKIRKAWADETKELDFESAWAILRDAYLNSEARARMENFLRTHEPLSWKCWCANDPRHNWIIADWEREVREEVEGA